MTALALMAFLAAADGPALSVKTGTAAPPDSVAVRKLLDAAPVVVADAAGETLAEFWFRSEIPSAATAEQVKNGLTYRELPDGVLLAAVRFPKAFVDYRKQDIPAGTYTLRYAVQPDTGDHTGTAPHPEFALLCPADKDATEDPLEPKVLHKLSAGVTGGDHPAVMLLFPHRGKPAEPAVADGKDGVKLLTFHRPVRAGGEKTTLGFAVTVAGVSKSR